MWGMAEEREPEGGAELREERKVVTTLFADLVGSTPLAERLEPEEVKLIVGEAVARIVLEVERFGDRVKDLARDGVLAFFGAPVTYEDDAERAVRAGRPATPPRDRARRGRLVASREPGRERPVQDRATRRGAAPPGTARRLRRSPRRQRALSR